MFYRLSNHDDPGVTFGLTSTTWYGILELAEENGWNPMGTMPPDPDDAGLVLAGMGSLDVNHWNGEYWGDEGGLVLFEDALNLADALERALLNYEPQYIPSLYYYTIFGENSSSNGSQPSLGAIQGIIDLCYLGNFKIEKA
jgi:hypothetical protein